MPPATDLSPAPGVLRLRPVSAADEHVVRSAHARMAEHGHDFASGLDPTMSQPRYLVALDEARRGIGLPAGRVAATFLPAVVDNTVVGRVEIRHQLTTRLSLRGEHIGYGLPEYRRRGYSTAILTAAVPVACGLGIDPTGSTPCWPPRGTTTSSYPTPPAPPRSCG